MELDQELLTRTFEEKQLPRTLCPIEVKSGIRMLLVEDNEQYVRSAFRSNQCKTNKLKGFRDRLIPTLLKPVHQNIARYISPLPPLPPPMTQS